MNIKNIIKPIGASKKVVPIIPIFPMKSMGKQPMQNPKKMMDNKTMKKKGG